jgi:hypothetical protein
MMRLADRFVVLDHGRVLATGLPRAVVGGRLGDRGLPGKSGWPARMPRIDTPRARSKDLSVAYGGLAP